MSVTERISEGFQATFVARVVSGVANGVLVVLLARLLGPDEYGSVFLALSVLGVAQLLSELGVSRSGARYVAEFSETDPTQIPHVIATTLTYRPVLIGSQRVYHPSRTRTVDLPSAPNRGARGRDHPS